MAAARGEGVQQQLLVGPDTHICGFCKQQFHSYDVFVSHKQSVCVVSLDQSEGVATGRASVRKAQKSPSRKRNVLPHKRHACAFSGCSFKTQYGQKDMERHILTHTGEKAFQCEACLKRFGRRDKLLLHQRLHTGEKPHQCHQCPYASADSSSLRKHLRTHLDQRPYTCQICPYASRTSSQLTIHLRSHTGDAPFQCQQCDAKFKINSDLKRHGRVHSGEKPFQCPLCPHRCAMKANLQSHVRLKHRPLHSLRCPACDFSCASKAELRLHARQHQPPRPQRCDQCSYSCSSRAGLRVHERVHSDLRPFRCDLCPFASKQRGNLFVHRKKCHREAAAGRSQAGEEAGPVGTRYRARLEAERGFHCDLCEASFVRADSLRSHRRQSHALLHTDSAHLHTDSAHPAAALLERGDSLSEAEPLGGGAEQMGLDHAHTFITACSDLDSLRTLIQEGGTEVTVVTEADQTSGSALMSLEPRPEELLVQPDL